MTDGASGAISTDREVFEATYAHNSQLTVSDCYALGIFPALPCDCGDEMCGGWRRRYSDDGPA